MGFRWDFAWKAQWTATLMNEVKLWESVVHKRQNERVHNYVHPTDIQYVQFMFTQNMNEFMNDRSLNAFRHNTDSYASLFSPHCLDLLLQDMTVLMCLSLLNVSVTLSFKPSYGLRYWSNIIEFSVITCYCGDSQYSDQFQLTWMRQSMLEMLIRCWVHWHMAGMPTWHSRLDLDLNVVHSITTVVSDFQRVNIEEHSGIWIFSLSNNWFIHFISNPWNARQVYL